MDFTLWTAPAFIALLLLEVWLTRRRGAPVHEARDSIASVTMGIGSVVVGMAWVGVKLGAYEWAYSYAFFDLGHGISTWIAAFIVVDFAYYWFHRLHHEVRVLWAAHVTHHSSTHYNLATALRQSWTPMTALIFYAPIPLLGFDPLMVVTVYSLNLVYQFWIHTEEIDRFPAAFEAVMNTPSHHRVHHGTNLQYLDRNHAGVFIVWDKLFGTFEPEQEKVVYGLTKNIDSYNPFWIAFHEWIAVIRDALRPGPWRTRLAYLIKPPGWSPDGSTHTSDELRALAA
ncbi:MAG: sterol desaturase family protein [bacterium]|nr:sterol desaturase family protein [bacterium]